MQILSKSLLLLIGLYTMALGVALSIVANIGITPIGCIPYILYIGTKHLTVGTYTTLLNCLYIFIQYLLKRNEFKKSDNLQLLIALIFGLFTDINLYLISHLIAPDTYLCKIALNLISCFVTGLGIFFILEANLLTLPVIGIVKVFASVLNKNYNQLKILSNVIFVLIGLVLSLTLCHKVVGIREGKLITAYFVGFSLNLIINLNQFYKV